MLWNQTFGGSRFDEANDIVESSEGGFFIVGTTESFGNALQVWLLKIDSNGELLWNRTYGSSIINEGGSLIQTTDGGLAIIGYTWLNGIEDLWLIKTNALGEVSWNRTYGGSRTEIPGSIIELDDGGFVLVGTTYSFGAGSADMWVVRTDPNGIQIWNQTYGGPKPDIANVIIETDTYFIIGGKTSTYNDASGDMAVMHIDKNGILLSNELYGNGLTEEVETIVQTSDGNFILVGSTLIKDVRGTSQIQLIEINTIGDPNWEFQCCDERADDTAIGLVQITENSFIIAGTTDKIGSNDAKMMLTKIRIGGSDGTERGGLEAIKNFSILLVLIPAIVLLSYILYRTKIIGIDKKTDIEKQ